MGSPLLSWNDVWLVAVNCEPGSRLAAALDERMAWRNEDWWLRSVEYSLRWLVWAKTKDGSKNRRKPKPVQAPGMENSDPNRRTVVAKSELNAMSAEQLREYLNRPRAGSETTE